ncbi:MAG: diguanylate cyclase [Candidatus Methylomirabilia bacterium]
MMAQFLHPHPHGKDRLLASWEQLISSFLHLFGLDGIKSKILVFALLATLIPSLATGWLSYVYNKRSLTEKVTEKLRNVTSHTAREIDFWLKARFYDVRVLSRSPVLSENLVEILRPRGAPTGKVRARRRLKNYLSAVREKFVDYEELLVIDPKGRVVATSAGQAGTVNLPRVPPKGAKEDRAILGDAYWDEALKQAVIMIAVPIRAANGRSLGALAAKINFRAIDETVRAFSLGRTGQVHLVTQDDTLLISSRFTSSASVKANLAAKTAQALFAKESVPLEYTDQQGRQVVGILKRVPQLDWAVVAEIGKKEAYAQIIRLRNVTLLVVSGLLLGGGLTAYLLGLTIVRPLDRLSNGAAKVAAGDLEVDLPVLSRGEVGYMTEIFNHMVARLRQGREELAAINKALSDKNEELAELSITDDLTGLYNRKHLMETLASETARARRHKHSFSVLMIDIDHFKKYNDSLGHLAGDAVLTKMASIFTECIRRVDYAARYGGDEFLVILPETELCEALEAAERIRTRLVGEISGDGNEQAEVTVSIGVTGFSEQSDTPESIIASADAALYEAKRLGRNRVVRATEIRGEE